MKKTFDFVLVNGRGMPNVSVSVYNYGTLTLATLWADSAGTIPLVNPVSTVANGYYEFYVADGRYSIGYSGTGVVSSELTDLIIDDTLDLSSTDVGKGASLVKFESGKTVQDLAGSAIGNGAALVSINDAGSKFTGTTVEAALQETRTAAELSVAGGATLVGSDDGSGGSLWTTVQGFINKIISSVGASVVGFIQSGTGAVATTVQTELRRKVSPMQFGATGDGVADDTTAVTNAAATGLPIYLGGKTYKITSSVTLTNNVYGPGKILSTGSMLSAGADGIVVDGVEFEGTATSGTSVPIALSAIEKNDISLINCALTNCRVTARNQSLAEVKNFRFQNNTVNADFTLVEHVTNQNDVVTVRGINGVWITDNNFTILNVHRVLKIADTEAATTSGTAYRARNVFVTGNRIVGSTDSSKQVIDLYFFTSDITISNNLIEVTGFGVVIENKTGKTQNYNQNTFITGNKISNDGWGIGLQGSYGATTVGYDVGYQNALIENNVVISTASTIGTTKYPITIRFYDDVQIIGNNIITPVAFAETTGLPGIVVYSCGYSTVSGNVVSNGCIMFSQATTNSDAEPFSATILSIVCTSNTVSNFGGSSITGGILIDNIGTASSLRANLSNNYIKQDVDDAASAGCIGVNNSTVNTLLVEGNTGVMASASEQRLRLITATITQVIERDNSWNQVGRASATYDPASIAAAGSTTTTLTVTGANFATDIVEKVHFSRALLGLVMTAWVSATDTVTVQFYNPTGGAIDLASGTLQVVVGRYTTV